MGSEREAAESVRFGVFEFRPRAMELRRNGVRMKLQDQPGQILAALLEAPGDLVRREELRRRLWPADTFVDFDHSLNTAVKRLRDVLGDSADHPIFIETLSRRGYRFMAPIVAMANGKPTGDAKANGATLGNGTRALVTNAAATGKWSARFSWWGWLAG